MIKQLFYLKMNIIPTKLQTAFLEFDCCTSLNLIVVLAIIVVRQMAEFTSTYQSTSKHVKNSNQLDILISLILNIAYIWLLLCSHTLQTVQSFIQLQNFCCRKGTQNFQILFSWWNKLER